MFYSIKAAAMATGVSASRLRTWERRYGIPLPGRSSSGRRRFEQHDLNIIRRMSVLIDSGMPASHAAKAVHAEGNGEAPVPVTPERAHPLVDLFVQKAGRFDQGWLVRIVRDSVYSTGWAPTMERIVFPALRRLNREWGEARSTMAHVQFAHELMRNELAAELAKLETPDQAASSVMLACAQDDQYDIATLALALLLRLGDLRVLYLGRSIPAPDLVEAARQIKPQAICLVGTRRASPGGMNRTARALVRSKLPVQLFVGGSVLTRRDAPEIPGIHLPQSLTAAAERIAASLAQG